VRLGNGTVECWGSNFYRQLGDGTTTSRWTPVVVQGLSDAVEIEDGYNHSCARLGDNTVECWGHNAWGQLGDGTTTDRSAPVAVQGLSGATGIAPARFRAVASL
jgi:alpha-tubulin suppressor-like RCC1 family protein